MTVFFRFRFLLCAVMPWAAWGQTVSYSASKFAGGQFPPPTASAGTSVSVPFQQYNRLTVDAGGSLYFGSATIDTFGGSVMKLDSAGALTRVYGGGPSRDGGAALNSQPSAAVGLATDPAGNLYVADAGSHRIVKITPDGSYSLFAGNGSTGYSGDGGQALNAAIWGPYGVAFDSSGNMYITSSQSGTIRRITPAGIISTIAGTGVQGDGRTGDGESALSTPLNSPTSIAVDAAGNVYFLDSPRIRKIDTRGILSTVLGAAPCCLSADGSAAANAYVEAMDFALDSAGNLFVTDASRAAIRRVSPAGIISTVAGYAAFRGHAGDGGLAISALLAAPFGIAVDRAGNIYVADEPSGRIRKISAAGTITTVAGGMAGDGGPALFASLATPDGIAVDPSRNVYLADTYHNRICKISPDGTMTTIAGTGEFGHDGDGGPAIAARLAVPTDIALGPTGNLFVLSLSDPGVRMITPQGVISTVATVPSGNRHAIAVDAAENVYVALGFQALVLRAAPGHPFTVYAGNGTAGHSGDGGLAINAQLSFPQGLAIDRAGNLYIADGTNVRRVSPDGKIATVAGRGNSAETGDGGPATSADVIATSIAVDASGALYIGSVSRVRKIDRNGTISTMAASSFVPGTAHLKSLYISGVAPDPAGGVYVADEGSDVVYRVFQTGSEPSLSVASTHAGPLTPGQSPVSFTVTVSNAAYAVPTAGTVTVTDLVPSGLSLTSASGPGWTCTGNSCSRSDSLAAGGVYPGINITGSLSTNVFSQLTNRVSVTGGGSAPASAVDLALTAPAPDMTVVMTANGTFIAGQATASYSIFAVNEGLTATSGAVTVNIALASGLSGVVISGTGWACAQPAGPCTRGDALAAGASYPPIALTVAISIAASGTATSSATVSGGGEYNTSNNIWSTVNAVAPPAVLSLTMLFSSGNLTPGKSGSFTITVRNVGAVATSGPVNVSIALPSGITGVSMSGTGWACTQPSGPCTRSDPLPAGMSYPEVILQVTAAANAPSQLTLQPSVSGGGTAGATASYTVLVTTGLGFYPLSPPCRAVDTRVSQRAAGPFGPPSLAGYASRDFALPSSGCGVPSTAQAYSLNATVVPVGVLDFLSLWQAGLPFPGVSTLNAVDGNIVANAGIVPSGTQGAITAVGSRSTDLILDLNGYFAPPSAGEVLYYPIVPCRAIDTRVGQGKVGAFGPPGLSGFVQRDFPLAASTCGLPSSATAYALNLTAVPPTGLGYLSAWPAGQPFPVVSTLNSPSGSTIANAAIVKAGTNGAITLMGSNATEVIVDVNGYFAAPSASGLRFYPLPTCRVADTRAGQGKTGAFGPPALVAYSTRDFPIASGGCRIPQSAQVYSLNITVVPAGPLDFLSAWPSGSPFPGVSTLNSPKGITLANAALIQAGNGGAVSIVAAKATDIIIDVNGYFAP